VPAPEIAIAGAPKAYTLAYGGKRYPLLKCTACGEAPLMKSNHGIVEEIERIGAYLKPKEHFCPNGTPNPETGEICSNHAGAIPVGTPKAYRNFGTNASGSKRVQCGKCKKVFVSESKPAKGQHDNRMIFSLLVNKVPLARIVRVTKVPFDRLYRRIDFIHRQCMAFAAKREGKLQTLPIDRLYLAIDKQDLMVNWRKRRDKRNIVLKSLVASDNKTGYVLVSALNYDETADKDAIKADALAIDDAGKAMPFRKYTRIAACVRGIDAFPPEHAELDRIRVTRRRSDRFGVS
jgi:hypothetical protein